MKKIILILAVLLSTFLLAVSCSDDAFYNLGEEEHAYSVGKRFSTLESNTAYKIVYDKETCVMYAVSNGAYNGGTFTLLVDAEGCPLLYGGE